jgi:hypothetical protein
MAMWNIVDRRGGRLPQAAVGMVHMGIGLVVLTEMNIANKRYPKAALGYTVMCSKVASCN